MKPFLSFLCLFNIIVSGCHAQQKNQVFKISSNGNTLLWQISGKGLSKPSFLFGTFHLLCKEDITFSDQLKSAIQYSNEVYMELDMDDPAAVMSGLLYMNMKDGKSLTDFYTAEEYKRIEHFFKDSLHVPLMMFAKAKPYFLIALLYPKMMKCKIFTGVETEIMKFAKENKKEILGLETMQFQSGVFDSIPYELQAKELIKNIDSLASYSNQFDTLMHAYKKQQLDVLEKGMKESEFSMEKYEDLLLYRRNENWVEQLKKIMKDKSVFIAVGAGHLVGEKGLISLLKKQGYSVKPLQNN